MTRTEEARLAVVEERLDIVDKRTERIEAKLDDAIACKADKTEVAAVTEAMAGKADAADFDELRRLLVGILISIAGFSVVTIIGIVLFRIGLQ